MNTALLFLDILAWGTAIISAGYSCITAFGEWSYNQDSALKVLDRMQGVERTYPWFKRAIPGMFASAWLLARFLS